MGYQNPFHELEDFIRCYERDFGAKVSFEDADRMITLFDELCDLFQKYEEGFEEEVPPFELFPRLSGR